MAKYNMTGSPLGNEVVTQTSLDRGEPPLSHHLETVQKNFLFATTWRDKSSNRVILLIFNQLRNIVSPRCGEEQFLNRLPGVPLRSTPG
jgi:hypothetical protein